LQHDRNELWSQQQFIHGNLKFQIFILAVTPDKSRQMVESMEEGQEAEDEKKCNE
jgi:hypothetical protein